ncbi:unnamed protein product [Bemisia tabaci]|uniref:Uncharacterized protein n=1 Tax=Bemisia tabaci TaxID=7038 RepID=A0A9P0F6E9_BEMTA|nr:unnamed protein product [Bemisia tabaci]
MKFSTSPVSQRSGLCLPLAVKVEREKLLQIIDEVNIKQIFHRWSIAAFNVPTGFVSMSVCVIFLMSSVSSLTVQFFLTIIQRTPSSF